MSAFRTAGAQSVVGSLWPLDDEVAPTLFEEFYSHLVRGETPAAALAAAQRAMIVAGLSPYHWAGLQVTTGP